MTDFSSSHGLWGLTAPPAPETSALAGEIRADVVVVGGGYTGLSAALHLAQGGRNVVVLEALDIGFGGSGRNVGLVNAGMWVMPDAMPDALGEQHGDRLSRLLGNGPDLVFEIIEKYKIDCEAVRTGTLHCAVGDGGVAEIKQRAAQWSARGAPVRVLDAAETAAKVGTDAYAGALLDLRAGTIQPLAYARGLAHAAIEAGAKIHTRSAVTGWERAGASWRLRTAGGAVSADWVIVATDAYTNTPWPEIRTEQVRLPYFNLATAPLSEELRRSILPERQGAWDTKEIMSSFRFDRAGRLVFGSIGALRGTGIHQAWAKRALRKLFPRIGDVSFVAEWYGWLGMTGNHLPMFHRLADNVVSFTGYNGRGIAPGTVFGRILAEHIQGRLPESELPLPVTAPAPVAFRRSKEAYYEVGAQIAHAFDAR